MVKSHRDSKIVKVILLFIVPIFLMSVVVGMGLFHQSLGVVSGNVKKPELSVIKDIYVELGELNCGESFSVTKIYPNALVIKNVSRVMLFFNLTGVQEEKESGALKEGSVNIVVGDRHSNGTWDEYLNVTLDILHPVKKGGMIESPDHPYDVKITVRGTTGYPENGAAIEFSIVIHGEPP